MSDEVETMANIIDRLYPDEDRYPDTGMDGLPDRDDLPELASALQRTGPIFHRGKDGSPVVYEALVSPDGTFPLVRRVAFLSRMVRSDQGIRSRADDASEARSRGARIASEVPVPKG